MRKMFALLSLLVVLSLALSACGGPSTEAPNAGSTDVPSTGGGDVPNPTTFVDASSSATVDTLDPALAYDTASAEILMNTMETLVYYDGAATDKFVPQLAESWETSEDGTVWTFHMRSGVKFHEGGDLTASDVAYSYHRGLLQGGYASPQWLLAEPFFGVGVDDISLVTDPEAGACADDRECMAATDPAVLVAACEKVKAAIVADDATGTVTMTLAQGWGPFLATIAQSWGSVMDSEWVMANGGWDGSCDTWQNFYGMTSEENPFSTIVNGTGAFKLDKLANGEEIVMVRNDNYWREPAKLEKVVITNVSEWGTRFTMMQAGDADVTDVPVENRSQMDALVGERCEYNAETNAYNECEVTDDSQPFRLFIGRPGLIQDVILFNFGISIPEEGGNNLVGSGLLDGNGIPADFFQDVHVRKGFAYAFDHSVLIDDVYNGEAVQSLQLPLPGMPGFDLNAPHYSYDPAAAEAEFKLADLDHDGIAAGDDPEGDIWTTGFRVQMAYNQGNNTRQIVAESLAGSLASINELFTVEILGLPWPAYLRQQRARMIPIMTGGWLEDIHDPHNWYQPYLTGAYGARQGLPEELKAPAREMLAEGVSLVDPAARSEVYYGVNQFYYDNAIGVPLVLATSHGFSQRWVKGIILNPIFPGNYYYTIYKSAE